MHTGIFKKKGSEIVLLVDETCKKVAVTKSLISYAMKNKLFCAVVYVVKKLILLSNFIKMHVECSWARQFNESIVCIELCLRKRAHNKQAFSFSFFTCRHVAGVCRKVFHFRLFSVLLHTQIFKKLYWQNFRNH